MNGVVLLLVALLGLCQIAFGVLTGPEPLPSDTSGWEHHLLANEFLIDNLDRHLIRLKDKLKTKTVDLEKIYRITEYGATRLEGTGCKDNEFQCGGIGRQCISEFLACDGVKDCVNGQDEDPVYCDVSELRAGVTFTGWSREGKCARASPRNQYFCRMRVTMVAKRPFHRSFMPMAMSSSCNMTVRGIPAAKQPKLTLNNLSVGRYYVASRRWISEASGYVSICQFTDNSFQIMHCEAIHGETDRCNNAVFIYRDD